MEPDRKQHPEIEPDIRPTLGRIDDHGLSEREQKALDKKLASADKQLGSYDAASDDNLKNIDDVREREEALTSGLYVGRGGAEKKQTASLKTILKKRGPLAAILALGAGLPTILAIIFSPALLLQQLSETLTGKINDQLSALDARSTLLLKKKYGSKITKGACGTVTIRCKYQTIREGSGFAKRLKAAGVEIKGDRSIIPGRIKPTHFVFDGDEIAARDLVKKARTNPALRSALRKGYDPLYAAFSDKVSAKVRAKLGLKKSSSVKSSTDRKKMNEDLKKTAAGENDNLPADGKKLTKHTDDNGNVTYTDSEGNTYTKVEGERLNSLIDESLGRNKLAEKVTKTAVKSTLKGALTSTALGAGAIDTLCTGWVMVRVASFAAKIYQQRQLIRYSYEFMKISHKQKYGDLTQEEMAFFGDLLTKPNSEGKAALDSDGFKFAAYGDVFQPASFESLANEKDAEALSEKGLIQNETSRYVNGQLLNDNMMTKLVSALTVGKPNTVQAADSVCKFTKSWKGQALVFGLAAAGAVLAFFSGGTSLGVGAALGATASITISIAFALIQPKLIDMVKGDVIKGDENGNETGNAITSGWGGYNAEASQGRGLRVATQSAYADYNQQTNKLMAEYNAADRASRSPFDPTSRNTFLGSIVSAILPYSTKMQAVGSSGLAAASLVTTTLSSLTRPPTSSADSDLPQFSQCDDNEYKDYAADPFCNLRYMLPDKEVDPDEVLDYMIKGNYITETDATPQGEYASYIERCIDRKTSIGDAYTEDGGAGDPGTDCVVGQGGANEKRNTMFALFYVDQSADEGLDNDFDSELTTAATTGGSELKVGSFNVRGASHTDAPGEDSRPNKNWEDRMVYTINTIRDNNLEVVGFQEFEPKQHQRLAEKMPEFELSNHGKDSDSIGWSKARFTKIDQGTWKTVYFGGQIEEPWVKLEDNATKQPFYVMNVHDPINRGAGDSETRYQNALAHLATVNQLKTDAPVILTGDFNSGYTKEQGAGASTNEKLAYCVLTKGGMNDAYDLSVPRPAKCPNPPARGDRNFIDHIYLTPEMQVISFDSVAGGYTSNGSDHPTVFANVVIPGSAESTGAGTSFVMGTYNQPTRGDTGAAAQKILGEKMDIIGMQEIGEANYFPLKSELGKNGYKVYPDVQRGESKSNFCTRGRSIFYQSSKFKVIKSEVYDVPSYNHKTEYQEARACGNEGERTKGGGRANQPIVWFQDVSTGQTIIVMNTHNLASCCGAENAPQKRYESAKIYVEKVRSLKASNPGVPIFFSGDFNEGTGVRRTKNVTYQFNQNNLLYCMFKQNGLMSMVIGGRQQPCATDHEGYQGVDYIYATPGVKVEWAKEFRDPSTNSSPHMVHYGKLVVPGSGGAQSGELAWPLDKSKYNTNKVDWLNSHGSTGTAWGEDNMGTSGKGAYIAADISATVGTPVYAMMGGTVTSTSLCGAEDGIAIKSSVDGGTLGIAYMHGKNKRFKKGETVRAGQQIMEVGTLGCNVYGSHLHIGMAYKGNYICPQDVFLALANKASVNWQQLVGKTSGGCGRI